MYSFPAESECISAEVYTFPEEQLTHVHILWHLIAFVLFQIIAVLEKTHKLQAIRVGTLCQSYIAQGPTSEQ